MFFNSLCNLDLFRFHRLRLRCRFDHFLDNRRLDKFRNVCDFGLFQLNDRFWLRFNNRLDRWHFNDDGFDCPKLHHWRLHDRRLFDRNFDLGNRMFRLSLFFFHRLSRRFFSRLGLGYDQRRIRFGDHHFSDSDFRFFGCFDGFRKLCFHCSFNSSFSSIGGRLFDRLFFDLLLAEGEHFLDEAHCHKF